jgi:hypothetical protein
MKTVKFITIALMVIITAVSFSYWHSRYASSADFPIFYNATLYFLHEHNGIANIYDVWISHEYDLPEKTNAGKFIYSPLILVLFSPLGYLDYYAAKTVLMSVNIICYALSIYLILRHLKFSGRWFVYPFFLSFIWAPFLIDVMMGQINSILLLLLILAVCSLENDKPVISGLFIGVAALFKIFPIGIAMTLGIKNRRVFISCFLFFIISIAVIPGAIKWFSAILSIHPSSISPAYRFLSEYKPVLFGIYSASIALITALLIHKTQKNDYLKIVSYSIPAVFLSAPVFESHHLTLLIVSFLFLVSYVRVNLKLFYIATPLISALVISMAFFAYIIPNIELALIHNYYYFSILLLWLTYSHIFISEIKLKV